MKTLVFGTGVLAGIAWLFPGLVVIGMFLGVVPGLVLMVMPTVFVYTLATWLIRYVLPIADDRAAYPIAGMAAITLVSLAMLPFRYAAERSFAAAAVPEIVPQAPIPLSGDVVFVYQSPLNTAEPPSCDWLCLAMLDLPAVKSVTLIRYGHKVTYALIAAEEGTPKGLQPYDPAQITMLSDRVIEGSTGLQVKAALEAHWRERLSGPQRLVTVATPQGQPDWQLRALMGGVTEIIGPDGQVRLRAVKLRRSIPAIPPYFAFRAGSAAIGFASEGFEIGGRERVTTSVFAEVLPDHLIGRNLALKDYMAIFAPAQP